MSTTLVSQSDQPSPGGPGRFEAPRSGRQRAGRPGVGRGNRQPNRVGRCRGADGRHQCDGRLLRGELVDQRDGQHQRLFHYRRLASRLESSHLQIDDDVDMDRWSTYNVDTEAVMLKKLTRQGNSSALLIEKPVMDLLGMTPDSTVEVRSNGHSLLVTPVSPQTTERRKAFLLAMEKAEKIAGPMLKRLAKR